MVSIRTDRFTYFEGEKVSIEAYLCNDTNKEKDIIVIFELYREGKFILSNKKELRVLACNVTYVANAEFIAPKVRDREKLLLKAVVLEKDVPITYNELEIEVFEDVEIPDSKDIEIIKLPVGEHIAAGEKVVVKPCGMLPVHFVSRNTGHSTVEAFLARDFSYWYDKEKDMITPILETTFEAQGFAKKAKMGIFIHSSSGSTTFNVNMPSFPSKKQ